MLKGIRNIVARAAFNFAKAIEERATVFSFYLGEQRLLSFFYKHPSNLTEDIIVGSFLEALDENPANKKAIVDIIKSDDKKDYLLFTFATRDSRGHEFVNELISLYLSKGAINHEKIDNHKLNDDAIIHIIVEKLKPKIKDRLVILSTKNIPSKCRI